MLVSKLHSGTSKTKQLVFVHLELPLFWKLYNLLTSMCDFVPCDRIVQRAYYYGAPNQSIFPTFFYGLFDFNTTFYMANCSLFIWSTRLFIWSTNHLLYGQLTMHFLYDQLTIFIWSTNHFLYGQHDFFMVNFRIFSNDDHNAMRPNSNKGRPIAGTLHKPQRQRKCRKTGGLMSHTMVLHVL